MSKLLAILNTANSWTQTISLSSPITANYVRILSNRQALITISCLAATYIYNPATNISESRGGLCLAGSSISYAVKDNDITRLVVKLEEEITSETTEVQLILYFHD